MKKKTTRGIKQSTKWLIATAAAAGAAYAAWGCDRPPTEKNATPAFNLPAQPWWVNERPMAESGYDLEQGVTMYRYTVMDGLRVVEGLEFFEEAREFMNDGEWLMYHPPHGESVAVSRDWGGPPETPQ